MKVKWGRCLDWKSERDEGDCKVVTKRVVATTDDGLSWNMYFVPFWLNTSYQRTSSKGREQRRAWRVPVVGDGADFENLMAKRPTAAAEQRFPLTPTVLNDKISVRRSSLDTSTLSFYPSPFNWSRK
jgi:hypothetical protein